MTAAVRTSDAKPGEPQCISHGQRQPGKPDRQRQRTDVEEDAMKRVPHADPKRALRPGADRRDAHRLGGPERQQGPEIDRM